MSEVANAAALAKPVVVQAAGVKQVWHVWGEGQDKPLLLFHGGSGSWTHWVRCVEALSAHRAVWALDLPGFGDSELPAGAQDVTDLLGPIHQGMRQLFGQGPVDVAGFSFGGMTAGLLAAQHPECFAQVLMLGTPGLGLFDGPPPNIRGFTAGMSDAEREAVHRHNLLSFMLKHEATVDAQTLQLQAENVARDRLKRRRLARTDVVLRASAAWKCPVHLAFGEADRLYPGRLHEIPSLFAPGAIASFEIIEDAGHWAMHERPQAVIDWILSKLGACSNSNPKSPAT